MGSMLASIVVDSRFKPRSNITVLYYVGGRLGHDRMVVGLLLPMQSVPITTDVVSSNLDQGEVYNIM
jgi:hypothetical protein